MALDQLLSKLDIPNPVVRQYAVLGVFDHILKSSGPTLAQPALTAIRRCLTVPDVATMTTTVEQLISLTQHPANTKLSAEEACDVLLTALAACPPSTAGPLAAGIMQLFTQSTLQQQQQEQKATANPKSWVGEWRSHILSKALLANPGTQLELIQGTTRLVFTILQNSLEAAGANASLRNDRTLELVRPFISFCLIDADLASAAFHSSLARKACNASFPIQRCLLSLLASHLPCYAVQTEAQRSTTASAVADLIDLLGSFEQPPELNDVAPVASGLLQVTREIAAAGGSPHSFLTALNQLAKWYPEAILPHIELVSELVSVCYKLEDTIAVLHLMSELLDYGVQNANAHDDHENAKARSGTSPITIEKRTASVVEYFLLQQLAFQQGVVIKQWCHHVLTLLRTSTTTTTALRKRGHLREGSASSVYITLPPTSLSSFPVEVVGTFLKDVWSRPSKVAIQWLHELSCQLQCISPASQKPTPPTTTTSQQQRQLGLAPTLAVCSFLQHSSYQVQLAAIRTLKDCLSVSPLLGISVLPVVVHRIQDLLLEYASSSEKAIQLQLTVLLQLLYTLPTLARHPAALPFIVRVIQPLQAASAPELMQGVALRLLCEIWMLTGRGFNHLEAAILGYVAPHGTPSLSLRIARAECLQQICSKDGAKATTSLITAIQECLEDPDHAVHAVGLLCIAELCESDVLDFYAAWKVVHRTFPQLPTPSETDTTKGSLSSGTSAAAAWVRLLACGGYDAEAHLDVVEGIVDALWAAMGHPSPQVRAQAYTSLAAYDMAVLEEINILAPLSDYARLLQTESCYMDTVDTDPTHKSTKEACERLVQKALAYEYATRRRQIQSTPPSTTTSTSTQSNKTRESSALEEATRSAIHKLSSSLPRLLLGGSGASVGEVTTRLADGSITIPSVLYFYAPLLSSSSFSSNSSNNGGRKMGNSVSSSSRNELARQAKRAAGDYASIFFELITRPVGLHTAPTSRAGGFHEGLLQVDVVLPAWKSFLKRWTGAERDSRVSPATEQDTMNTPTTHRHAATTAALLSIWSIIQETFQDATVTAAENLVWSAAALCCVSQDPPRQLIHDVHAVLVQTATKEDSSQGTRCAALSCLGYIAPMIKSALGGDILAETLSSIQSLLVDVPVVGAKETSTAMNVASVKVAAAEGLAAVCRQLCTSSNRSILGQKAVPQSITADQVVVTSCVSTLISIYCSSLPMEESSNIDSNERKSGRSAIIAAATADGLNLQVHTSKTPSSSSVDEGIRVAYSCAIAEVLSCLTEIGCIATMKAISAGALECINLFKDQIESKDELQITHLWSVIGACYVLAVSTPFGYQHNWLNAGTVNSILHSLLSLLVSGSKEKEEKETDYSGAVDGKLSGTVAFCIARILSTALRHGYSPPATTLNAAAGVTGNADEPSNNIISEPITPQLVAARLLHLIDVGSTSKIPHSAAAKQGAAAGLAYLLKSGVLTPSASSNKSSKASVAVSEFKKAVAIIEALAIKESDVRVKQRCAWVAAELCHHAKHAGLSFSSLTTIRGDQISRAGGAASAAMIKGLSALPPGSAMKVLVETLIDNAWPLDLIEEEENNVGESNIAATTDDHSTSVMSSSSQSLTACTAAAILRCLVTAPRLPALDWTATCRKLLKQEESTNTTNKSVYDEVYMGCVDLAAVHAARAQAYQLTDFVSVDLLSSATATTTKAVVGLDNNSLWTDKRQRHVLKKLPGLLAAVPVQHALDVIRMLCSLCPDLSSFPSDVAVESHQESSLILAEWQEALLIGIHGILSSASSRSTTTMSSSFAPSPEIIAAARQGLVRLLLPKLPHPATRQGHGNLFIFLAKQTLLSSPDSLASTRERCWKKALLCLQALSLDHLSTLLLEDNENGSGNGNGSLHVGYAIVSLVTSGALSLRALQYPRNLIFNGTLLSSSSGNRQDNRVEEIEEELLAKGIAVALQNQGTVAEHLQWLIDITSAIGTCRNKFGALKLAASLAATLASTLSEEIAGDAVALSSTRSSQNFNTMSTPILVLQSLPYHVAIITQHLAVTRAAAGQEVVAAFSAAFDAVKSSKGEGEDSVHVDRLWASCLVAMRHQLSEEQKAVMCSLLA